MTMSMALRAAFGARGQHILLAQFLKKRILGEQRHGGEGRQPHRKDRQRQVPEIIADLVIPGELRPAVRHQSAQRKDLKERAAGEQDDKQNGEQKSRNGVADDDDAGRPHVERRAVLHRLADAERDGDQIAQ
jgi:hypothetical protein